MVEGSGRVNIWEGAQIRPPSLGGSGDVWVAHRLWLVREVGPRRLSQPRLLISAGHTQTIVGVPQT